MKLAIAILVPLLVGFSAGLFTASSINEWYVYLNKPVFNPPNWLFAPVWTVLYIVMGVALYLVWRLPVSRQRNTALVVFAVQLAMNFLWSFIFFGAHAIAWALADIVLLLALLLFCIRCFARLDTTASWLLVPYLLWVAYATLLNAAILWLNGSTA